MSEVQSHSIIEIWPEAVPGETQPKADPKVDPPNADNTTHVTEITNPTLTVFEPKPDERNGVGVVVFPGGGYGILAIDKEGTEIGQWLADLGYTAFVLAYRVPDKKEGALQDAIRAMKLVRSSADDWKINPDKIGVIGFSAGGSLAARLCARFDEELYPKTDGSDETSALPNFAALIYPAYLDEGPGNTLTPEVALRDETPPMFLFVAADDELYANSSFVMGAALREANKSVELHVYPEGRHGYGMRKGKRAAETWPKLCEDWLNAVVLDK